MNDLRFALRQLAKSPGVSAVTILSLAIGIGATATVLCWLRHLVLRPLPGIFASHEIVVFVSNQGGGNVSLPDLNDFVAETGMFSGALASMPTPASLTVDNQPEWIQAQIISANAFELLGVKPLLGRGFLPGEDQKPGGDPVLVISERLWRRRFNADPDIVGRVVDLNRHAFTIVGVLPSSFRGTMTPMIYDVWAPASMIWEVRNQSTNFLSRRSARGWHNLARLRPGVSLAEARAAVDIVAARLARTFPDTNRDIRHRVVPLSECPWGAQSLMSPVLRLLLAVCAGVLLIVAANVANLLLARANSRQKEIAIRLASGATRGRLVRQLLTESIVLALCGGAAGLLVAHWAVDALPLLLPNPNTNLALEFELDGVTVGLVVLVSLATGVAFGLVPALQASRPNLNEVLKESGRASSGGLAHNRARNTLVVAEVALSLVLLVGAALCVQGLGRARQIALGFNPERVLLGELQIGMNGYNRDSGRIFYRQLHERLATLPGVEDAALASWFPLGLAGCKGTGVEVDGYVPPPEQNRTYEFAIVSPRYFSTMRIPLLAGRDFTSRDDGDAPDVAIVNEAFAHRFWPGQDAMGRKFRSGGRERTIVGVAQNGKYNRLDEVPACFLYLPYLQGVPDLDLNIAVRSTDDPALFGNALREAVRGLDPGVELLRVTALTTHIEAVFFVQRLATMLLALLGGVALVLAAVGVYAVIAYAVSRRIREFGIRLALGAVPVDVLRLVLGQGLILAGGGVLIGLGLASALARLMSAYLYGVSPFDVATFIGVPVLLILVAIAACWIPAWRATRVDPVEALRAE